MSTNVRIRFNLIRSRMEMWPVIFFQKQIIYKTQSAPIYIKWFFLHKSDKFVQCAFNVSTVLSWFNHCHIVNGSIAGLLIFDTLHNLLHCCIGDVRYLIALCEVPHVQYYQSRVPGNTNVELSWLEFLTLHSLSFLFVFGPI